MRVPGTFLMRFGRIANSIWQLLGVAITLIIVADLVAAILLRAPGHPDALGSAQSQVRADGGARWSVELYREESRLSDTWYPYVYWKSRPFEGRYLHVGANGLRFTSNNRMLAGNNLAKPFRIFMFGGSTMFGLGAPDDDTIPSLLERALQHDGISNVQITNFGQIGYVSTQEVIELSEQLRLGNIPNLVIFYDGINDAAASYQNGVAGVPQNEFNRVREFNLLNQADPAKRTALYAAAGIAFVDHTALGELARVVATRYTQPLFNRIRNLLPYNRTKAGMAVRRNWDVGKDSAALPKTTVDSYLENIRLVEAEGKQLGFASLFYWQPVLYSKPHQSELEKAVVQAARNSAPGMERFMQATYYYARGASERITSPRVHDISNIFAGVRDTCFVDLFHITGNCNEIVAARMGKDVIPLVEHAKPQTTVQHTPRQAARTKDPGARSLRARAVPAAKRG